jgi:hypothetical protein
LSSCSIQRYLGRVPDSHLQETKISQVEDNFPKKGENYHHGIDYFRLLFLLPLIDIDPSDISFLFFVCSL